MDPQPVDHGRRNGAVAAMVLIVAVASGGYALVSLFPHSAASSSYTTVEGAQPSTTSGGSQGPSLTTGQSAQGLAITNMFADVYGPGLQFLYSNSSSVGDRSTFEGSTGETFQVLLQLIYLNCGDCPSQVQAVIAGTPGFVVVVMTPAAPVPLEACPSVCTEGTTVSAPDGMQVGVTVTVTAPQSPYSGTLSLEAQTG